MLSGDAAIAQVTELIQSDLLKIGIRMKVREIEFNQLVAMLENPKADWQAAGLGETATGFIRRARNCLPPILFRMRAAIPILRWTG